MADRLGSYRRKRDFTATPEPSAGGKSRGRADDHHFVVQLHHARARHFDFRLQVGDSLRSWAVPKGPSLDPRNKRLAVEVEDHPLKYGEFEGEIPAGQYGAGEVRIWDQGDWSPDGDAERALRSGHLRFTLHGQRLRGAWSLIRTRLSGKKPQWLLIKSHDAAERRGDEADDTPLSEWSGNGGPKLPRAGQAPSGRRGKSSGTGKSHARVKKASARKRLPAEIDLQLARLVDEAPEGEGWLHEVKFDGYRILLWRNGEQVRITSRGDQDWTARLAATADAARQLPCDSCILDGEVVALDAEGRSSFGQLQQLFGQPAAEQKLSAMIFDLLYLNGEDLRAKSQLERKNALGVLLKKAAAPLKLTQYVIGHGDKSFKAACEHGLEGIVSKDASAPYAAGRGGAWLKTKCVESDEFAIVGYTTGKGARADLGALLLASPAGQGHWRYRGRVGTGLPERTIRDLLKRLDKTSKAPELEQPPTRVQLRGAAPIWVTPKNVAEVEFRGYTEDGLLRQASLKGLREDRSVRSLKPGGRDRAPVRSPVPAAKTARPSRRSARAQAKRTAKSESSAVEVRLTHPERVLFKDPKITKQELADFYREIADFILPGLINRPQMLLRCPAGASGECFFQKHVSQGFPDAVHEVKDGKQSWIYIQDLKGLLSLVQMSALEYHVWGCTVADLERADRIVMDLDPGPKVPWKQLIEAALALRERLSSQQLISFVRTTGGKGLHVVIPLNPACDWDLVGACARELAENFAAGQPERYVAVAAKAKRPGRIFIDYLRNGRGSTAVCSYSLRNRPGTPIATPLSWEELPRVRAGDQFRFDNIRKRLKGLSDDPWAGIERLKQSLPRPRR